SVGMTGGLAFHPDGRRAYAIDYSAPALVEFDVGTAHISRRLPLEHVDVRDLLLVDAGHNLCAAIASRDDVRCGGERLSLAGLLRQVKRLDACAAPFPRSFRRPFAERVGRAARLANRLERDVRHGRRGKAVAQRRARLDHALDALATWVTERATARSPHGAIAAQCGAELRTRIERVRSAASDVTSYRCSPALSPRSAM